MRNTKQLQLNAFNGSCNQSRRVKVLKFLMCNSCFHNQTFLARPQIKHDYPLNLSISVSGGKESNNDFLSNGE